MQTTEKTNKALPKRSEIDDGFKWRLENIYPDNNEWERDYNKIKELLSEIKKLNGTLEKSADNLLDCLKLRDRLLSIGEKLFVYARMKRDEDNTNPVYQALTDRAMALVTNLNAEISFIEPEIISMDESVLKEYIDRKSELQIYRHFFDDILRQKKHTLSQREEELLALTSEIAQAPADIFLMLNNADIKFPFIKDENGEMVELTKGRYIKFLESTDRRVRKDAYGALYSVYKKFQNTFAASLSNSIKKDLFFAKVRKYNSDLEASLSYDNISTDVYDNLIRTVDDNLHLLHRYVDIRKKAMGLEKLYMYDLYVPVVKEPVSYVDYQKACSIVEKGLHSLGPEYSNYLKQAFSSGWIDVYENEGKTGGAYSWGSYLTHPYVLLNFQNSIKDVFTIAHELGHALHTFYTNKTQPYVYSEYRIFVAEVASIVNEFLVMDYLLKNSKNKEEKAYLLNNHLEDFRGTLFRQTMFAEFEKIIHDSMSRGEALTCDALSDIYSGLNKKYYGDIVIVDDEISMEWARIPHFYTSFYVYKYATGFSAAASLSKQIIEEGEPAVKRYIKFLSSGGADYPINLLKNAGVDLTTPAPIEDALKKFESILEEFEAML
ncbi:MAG TPA: oligoendopeptidase F [Clostridiaceae bacterium]|nr:oligoendopeptidase F [Clostridiaceae bacterium]